MLKAMGLALALWAAGEAAERKPGATKDAGSARQREEAAKEKEAAVVAEDTERQRQRAELDAALGAGFEAAHGPKTWSKEGYETARWGMPRSVVERLSGSLTYVKTDDDGDEVHRDMRVLPDRFESRLFIFNAGLLSEVTVLTDAPKGDDGQLFTRTRDSLTAQYGRPFAQRDAGRSKDVTWRTAETTIHLTFSQRGELEVQYLSRARAELLEKRERAAKKDAADKAR